MEKRQQGSNVTALIGEKGAEGLKIAWKNKMPPLTFAKEGS